MTNTTENKVAYGNNEAANQDYAEHFMPSVHKIGRITMAIAFILAFLPIGYFLLVKGYTLPTSSYINTVVAISSIGIGMWLTEPMAYWPVLGSAGTYIAYLSGNVGGMRFPVAMNIQASLHADINTPRGQVATIVGIVASVFSNLMILFVIVLAGSWLITVLPDSVIAAFAYVMPGLFGSMLAMRFGSNKGGIVKGFTDALPYLATAMICKYVLSTFFPHLFAWGTAISVAVTVLVAYIMYRVRISKAAKAA